MTIAAFTAFDPTEATVRERLWDAIKSWEFGRLVYNVAQLVLTLLTAPFFENSLHWFRQNLGIYVGAAVVANLLYLGVYCCEPLFQTRWLYPIRRQARWAVIVLVTIGACFLAWMELDMEVFRDPRFAD